MDDLSYWILSKYQVEHIIKKIKRPQWNIVYTYLEYYGLIQYNDIIALPKQNNEPVIRIRSKIIFLLGFIGHYHIDSGQIDLLIFF
jgi:hypothetical protein